LLRRGKMMMEPGSEEEKRYLDYLIKKYSVKENFEEDAF
jgi:hypothetical protein